MLNASLTALPRKINMSLEDAANRLATALEKLANVYEKQPSAVTSNAQTPAPRRGRPPLAEKAVMTGSEDDLESVLGDVPLKYEDVRNAVLKVVARKNPAAALAVLETFGVRDAKSLKPEQYRDAIEKLDAI